MVLVLLNGMKLANEISTPFQQRPLYYIIILKMFTSIGIVKIGQNLTEEKFFLKFVKMIK